jgi:hypothetical protein
MESFMETAGYSKLRDAQAASARAFKLRLAAALAMSDDYDVLNADWLAAEETVERITRVTSP